MNKAAFGICTMTSGDWFVSSLYPDIEELAVKAGGHIDGYELSEMGGVFSVPMSEDSNDPHDDVLKAIEADQQHQEMFTRIRAQLT